MHLASSIDRRDLLLGGGAAGLTGMLSGSASVAVRPPPQGLVVSVTEFGARSGSGEDSTRAIQAAVDEVQRRGGGTVLIPGSLRCGNILVSRPGVRLQGIDGWLVDGRLTIDVGAEEIEVVDLGLIHTRGEPRSWLADISGRNCRFDNFRLVKDPPTGGYQMFIRQSASGCRFTGLRLKGSNGIMVAGHDHSFEDFEIEGARGDDAFAIKALGEPSYNIAIRNGVVRGLAAIASFGSEIGTPRSDRGTRGSVRRVTVENVVADRCATIAFFKPGALIYDWRNGLVEDVTLRNLRLDDSGGERFGVGIRMMAGRGATIRNVAAEGIRIRARAVSEGVFPTAAIHVTLLDKGAPATIEDIALQVSFVDPYGGAPHGSGTPGYPVDHVVRFEKSNPRRGSLSNVVLDVEGYGTSYGGIVVGRGMDDAVTVRRAILKRVATNPRASIGGGGIWSSSRIRLGEVEIDSVRLPDFGGPALAIARD